MQEQQKGHIENYLKAVTRLYNTGITAEHSFRGDLCNLLENLTNYQVINEAKHIDCGAPDLTLLDKNRISVGYVEAKDIGKNLNDKNYKEQFTRYKKALDNLIITDYLTFQYFRGEELVMETVIGKEQNDKIIPLTDNFNKFIELIKNFSIYNGRAIKNSAQLAEFMAAKTTLLAEAIQKTLETNENSSLHSQLKGFKEVLLPDITNPQFADMYAQTVAYGLFVAILQDNTNSDFTREKAVKLIPTSNPFLKQLFKYVSDEDNIDKNIVWIVDSLADMFNYTAIDDIHKEFISKDKDPFLHFYEDFLTKYDKKLKNAKGAYYTPQAVVTFIVNAVNDILKTDFNLSKGLAENAKVNIKNKEYHKVQILDPATGTGTFLAEVLRNIHKEYEGNEGIWNTDVKEHILKRLNGFEIMMSPYTMAHLKLEMLLQEYGINKGINPLAVNQRLQIYLTDSLETPKQNVPKLPFAQWLSDEATQAAKIKNEMPVMVVLGNPPYSGESQNKSEWILKLMEDYKKEPTGGRLQEKNPKWLNDDYAKFIRFGQHFIEKNGEGILAYINNHSFLDNPTFRGMRYNLLQTFDKIYIIDLHGNAKKKETVPDGSKDENVFDIQQGVSINIFVKTRNNKGINPLAEVFHYDIFGKRNEKYSYLIDNNLNSTDWEKLNPENPFYFFVPKNNDNKEEYEKGFLITELFYFNSVGIVTARDNFTIHDRKEDLIKTINEFKSLDNETARKYFDLGKDSRDWTIESARKDIIQNFEKNIIKINYRPFDTKYTYFTGNSKGFHCMPRGKIMQNFTNGENFGLICKRGFTENTAPIFFTNKITDFRFWSRPGMQGGDFVFPLYLYQENFGKIEKALNLNTDILFDIQYNFIEGEEVNEKGQYVNASGKEINIYFEPIDLIDYIYAILHSPSYREKYKEFLKIDFPRIPYPENAEQFNKLAAFGEKLRNLHLLENISVPNNFANYPVAGNDDIENSFTEKSNDYRDGKVWINDTQYFDNVPAAAWKFYIGGYQPAQKWLKDRKGRKLEDKEHYRKIIYALAETAKIMEDIDK